MILTRYPLIILVIATFLSITGCQKDNKLNVQIDSELNPNDVRIDLEVMHSFPVRNVYSYGKQYEIPNEYGENDWFFVYKDSLKAEFRHFKTNRNHTHHYLFKFYKRGASVFVDVNIKGTDELTTTLQMK